ncbi:MAG: hypothetical protein CR997_10760 [Acidobacteria bacterium]|nr:MAG: hypothetical protein CR997_10760 [Acidobacteriota bacterium]
MKIRNLLFTLVLSAVGLCQERNPCNEYGVLHNLALENVYDTLNSSEIDLSVMSQAEVLTLASETSFEYLKQELDNDLMDHYFP